MQPIDQGKKNHIAYARLLNKCWEDPAYLEKFRTDPAAALAEFGIDAPAGARFHIVAPEDMKPSTKEDVYLYYMPKPDIANLVDQALDQVAGGEVNKLVDQAPDKDVGDVYAYTDTIAGVQIHLGLSVEVAVYTLGILVVI